MHCMHVSRDHLFHLSYFQRLAVSTARILSLNLGICCSLDRGSLPVLLPSSLAPLAMDSERGRNMKKQVEEIVQARSAGRRG